MDGAKSNSPNLKVFIIVGIVVLLIIAIVVFVIARGGDNEVTPTDNTQTGITTTTKPTHQRDNEVTPTDNTQTDGENSNVSVGDSSIRVTVDYEIDQPLPEGSVMTVVLEDVTLMDVASTRISEQTITVGLDDPPVVADLPYDSGVVSQHNTYSVAARIEDADGNLLFTTDTAFDVLTGGNPKGTVAIWIIDYIKYIGSN